MRRRSNLYGLGAFLLLCACSDDSFTSAPAKPSDAGNGGGQTGTGGSQGTGGTGTGGASPGTGGAKPGTGGAPIGGMGGANGGVGGVVSAEAGVAGTGAGGAPGPQTWCTGQTVLFCEDFDRYTDVTELLNAPGYNYSLIGGQFSLASDGSAPSKPNSLRMTTTAQTDVKALLAHTLPPFTSLPNRVRVDFTLRVNKVQNLGAFAGAAIVALLNGREVSDGGVAVAFSADLLGNVQPLLAYVGPTPTDGGAAGFGTEPVQGASPPLNQWIGRYSIDIQYGGASTARVGNADLLAGGASLLQKKLVLPTSLSSPTEITVVMGFYSAGLFSKSGDLEVELDNVVVTAS